MLPDTPVPWAPKQVRERNEKRSREGLTGEERLLCVAPLADKRIGFNADLATNVVMDPNVPDCPASGVLWVGATCAKKVPAGYRIAWKE